MAIITKGDEPENLRYSGGKVQYDSGRIATVDDYRDYG